MDLRDLERDAFMAHAETIARLIHTPEWEAWESLLKNMKEATVDQLTKAASSEDLRFFQGAVAAMTEVLTRPHEIVDAARELHDAEAEDEKNSISVRRSLELHAGPLVDEV
jgi:hypothetical protein